MTQPFVSGKWKSGLGEWLRAHRRDVFVLSAILAFSLLMFVLFRRDPTTTDDRRDFVIASNLLDLKRGASHYKNGHYRLGWFIQVAFGQAILGKTAAAYYSVAIFNSLLSVGGSYLLVRQFFPLAVAAAAAWLVAVNPYFLAFSSWLFVDLAVTGWFLLGLTCTVVAARADTQREPRVRIRFAILAGLFLWLAWWTKVSIAPMLLLVPMALWVVPRDLTSWRAARAAFAVFALLVLCELIVNQIFLRSALLPFKVVAHAGTSEYAQKELIDTGKVALDLTWHDLYLRYPQRFLALAPGWIFLTLTALGSLIALVTRNRVLLWWIGMAFVSWAFISLTFNSLDPLIFVLRTKLRYVHAAFVLLLIVGTVAIALVCNCVRTQFPRASGWVTGITWAAVIALSAYQLGFHARHPISYGFASTSQWTKERVYPQIGQLANDGIGPERLAVRRIVTDYHTGRVVRLFLKDPENLPVEQLDRGHDWTFPIDGFQPGDLIVLNWGRLRQNSAFKQDAGKRLIRFLVNPPSEWERLSLVRDAESSQSEAGGSLRLYYIPGDGDR